jgi:hypothetical protein
MHESVVTGNETGCFQFDPQTKRQSMEWRLPGSPKTQKVSISKAENKVMLVTYYDGQGIFHKEFVPPGQTVKKEYYV